MIVSLLVVNFLVALVTSALVAALFNTPIRAILNRIVPEALSTAWHRYIKFAIFVVGVSGGVRVWELEKYITARNPNEVPVALNSDRWALEIYRTIIETLQSTAWMLLVVFMIGLIAFVIVRGQEMKYGKTRNTDTA